MKNKQMNDKLFDVETLVGAHTRSVLTMIFCLMACLKE